MIAGVSRRYLQALLSALLLAVAPSASAATSAAHPYRISPTRRCLIRHGAHVSTQKPLPYSNTPTLVWAQGHHSAGNPISVIAIAFYPNPAAGLTNERQDRHQLRDDRFDPAWIRHHLMRRQNVVASSHQRELNAPEIATIVACLKP
jgi:hypothetical protein